MTTKSAGIVLPASLLHEELKSAAASSLSIKESGVSVLLVSQHFTTARVARSRDQALDSSRHMHNLTHAQGKGGLQGRLLDQAELYTNR